MNIAIILEMAASNGDRPAVTADGRSLSAAWLLDLARAAASRQCQELKRDSLMPCYS